MGAAAARRLLFPWLLGLCVGSAGCFSGAPLDGKPEHPLDRRLLGSWTCVSPDDEQPVPATLIVRPATADTYDVTWQEAEKSPEQYSAHSSRLGRVWIMNIQVPEASSLAWTFATYSLAPNGVLTIGLLTDKGWPEADAPRTPAAARKAVQAALRLPEAFGDLGECRRIGGATSS